MLTESEGYEKDVKNPKLQSDLLIFFFAPVA